MILGLGVRFYHLAYFPLWRDEAFTRFYVESPISYLWTTGFRLESNPPGYYTLVHGWMQLFGTNEFALRSFSALASTLAIVIVYALGKELADRKVGLVAALLFALSPSEIWYAQEARTYALLQVAVSLMVLGLARFFARPSSIASLSLYVAGAIGAAYCHDTALFLIVACNLAVGWMAWRKPVVLTRDDLMRWLIANGVLALALLPLVDMMRLQMGSANVQWMAPLSPKLVLATLSEIVGGEAAHLESWEIYPLLLFVALGVALWRPAQSDRRTMTVLVTMPLLFIGVVILVSLRQPIVIPRVFLWLWIPLSVLIAQSVLRGNGKGWAVLAVTLLVFGIGLKTQLFPSRILKEDWRNLGIVLPQPVPASALIVFGSSATISPLAYYHPELLPNVRFWEEDKATPADFTKKYLNEKFPVAMINSNDLQAAIASMRPVFLFFRIDGQFIPYSPPDSLPAPAHHEDKYLGNYRIRVLSWNGDAASPTTALARPN